MSLTRRNALALGSASFVVTLMPLHAFAAKDETMTVINSFTGGAAVTNGGINFTTPEIAENGNTVPIKFSAPGAKRVMILADGNPTPGVGLFNFGKLSDASGSTRIRLAGTQDVIAVAEMADGSYVQVANTVKVTIGGCGG
ncbi:thiosulfate oxidation carrier protein SoxY [Amylibacter sp.]|nr:thiosulfate oxidation carrier protein SoxY [Amylibacter sp.]